jgi:hypothetical protein
MLVHSENRGSSKVGKGVFSSLRTGEGTVDRSILENNRGPPRVNSESSGSTAYQAHRESIQKAQEALTICFHNLSLRAQLICWHSPASGGLPAQSDGTLHVAHALFTDSEKRKLKKRKRGVDHKSNTHSTSR